MVFIARCVVHFNDNYPSGILRTSGSLKVYFCHTSFGTSDQVTVCTGFFLEEVVLVAVPVFAYRLGFHTCRLSTVYTEVISVAFPKYPLPADSFSKYKTKVIPNKVCIIRLYTIKYCTL